METCRLVLPFWFYKAWRMAMMFFLVPIKHSQDCLAPMTHTWQYYHYVQLNTLPPHEKSARPPPHQGKEKEAYEVAEERFVLPETLHNPWVFSWKMGVSSTWSFPSISGDFPRKTNDGRFGAFFWDTWCDRQLQITHWCAHPTQKISCFNAPWPRFDDIITLPKVTSLKANRLVIPGHITTGVDGSGEVFTSIFVVSPPS